MADYTLKHACSGIKTRLPKIEVFLNQYKKYDIYIEVPEFTSICPKTGLPDFGTLTIRYRPRRHCLELKSLKMYLLAYRDLGIFNENAVNRVLEDVVKAAKPVFAEVKGEFRPRGGMTIMVSAKYPRK